ncbi:extracellular matrix protein precursor, partial [Metarhizium majus ARSEF 297]
MKYALVISALAALAAAAEKPKFLNSNFQVTEGQSFDLKFDGCEGGCTITLQDGPNSNLKDYKVISTSATGGSLAWVPEGVVSGTYAFKITNNANKEYNYSQQFSYLGTGATVTASGASTTGSSTGSATATATATATASSTEASSIVSITASSTESSTESRTASTTISTVTSSATTASGSSTTSAPSSATSHSSTSTRSTTAATTTVPNSGVRATPMAFVAGAIAALAYLG